MRLMPVRSPLSLAALGAGIGSWLSSARASAARDALVASIRAGSDREVVLVDSGTSALSLALRGSGTAAGRPAALPAFACYDVATATDGAQVPFILYDLDPTTLGPDMDSLRRALAAGADRVVVAHLYGIPVDMAAVAALATEYGALVIEDAAQGVGGRWNDAPLGEHGSIGILSFGRGKGMTGGRGGAILGNDVRGRDIVRNVTRGIPPGSSSAMTAILELTALAAQWALARRALYQIPASLPFLHLGETTYRTPHAATLASALSLGTLSRTRVVADAEAEIRRRNASRLQARANPARSDPIRVPPGSLPGYLRLPRVRTATHGGWDLVAARRLGIMTSYPRSLADLDGFGARQIGGTHGFPGARSLAERLITLPVHGSLTEGDLARLEQWCSSEGAA